MRVFWLGLALLFSATVWAAPPSISARAWIVIDQASGHVLADSQADLPLPPASLTQMMTAYVLLDDLRKNKLSLGELITVPPAATQVDGARLFLTAGEKVSVDTLLQGMLVESAGDAVITLVTAAEGNETAFVARMNREARRLGMTKTRFLNATGLSEPGHESSARDLALLGRALARGFPDRMGFFLQKTLQYKGATYYNGNRLLWRDDTVIGLKAGRTPQAGYCTAALAQRGDQRRLAVVLNARTDVLRAQNALKLLNFGFENFDSVLLYRARQALKSVRIYRGDSPSISMGFEQDFHMLVPRGSATRVKAEIVTRQPVVAPIRTGQNLGVLRLTLDGQPFGDYPMVALHNVGVAGIFGRVWDSLQLFFAR